MDIFRMSTKSLLDPFSSYLRKWSYAANQHLAAICPLSAPNE